VDRWSKPVRSVATPSPAGLIHHLRDRQGGEFFKAACQRHLEGIISKRATAPYRAGRGGDWVKTKCTLRRKFVIGGYRYETGIDRYLGSLLIGYSDRGKLIYAGSARRGHP
jgi:bifunctional non-homologous end joining protein LigD